MADVEPLSSRHIIQTLKPVALRAALGEKLRQLQTRLASWLEKQPERVLWCAILACLALFWLSLLAPRSDNQLIGSDGTFYYSYLPSLLLDRDLDFTDEYSVFFAENPSESAIWLGEANLTAKGVPGNQWSIGPAILWTPFFLFAHILALVGRALGFAIDTQGYGMLYQAIVISANILFAGIGLWFIYRLAAAVIGKLDALLAALLILFAGNLVYYMTVEPHMAHSGVLMISGLFFWLWYRAEGAMDARLAMTLGALAGLMALIRPQAGLLLVIPFLIALPNLWRAVRARDFPLLKTWTVAGLLAGVTSFAVFSPQLFIWKSMYGGYFSTGYTTGIERLFLWTEPKLWQTLLSSGRGLFVWHPIFLAAMIGLWFVPQRTAAKVHGRVGKRQPARAYKRKLTKARHSYGRLNPAKMRNLARTQSSVLSQASTQTRALAVAGVLTFVLQWYLISSWNNWWQGYAFGGRMFIVCTPFFVLGLAALIKWMRARFDWRLLGLLGALLVGFNLLFVVQYRLVLFLKVVLPTWYDVTIRRVAFLFELFG